MLALVVYVLRCDYLLQKRLARCPIRRASMGCRAFQARNALASLREARRIVSWPGLAFVGVGPRGPPSARPRPAALL